MYRMAMYFNAKLCPSRFKKNSLSFIYSFKELLSKNEFIKVKKEERNSKN